VMVKMEVTLVEAVVVVKMENKVAMVVMVL
jgi:hypothetical protein